ncbi:LysR family transcriptional regulator [[Clostridium] dakarense]|uniref:LysR family transcriptional regulator n=1 Tax=Faecalimicrobium dakarense TaxID=1301100 RepID=UPI0004BC3C76|nr:LysR family transcriptional regulator [[Clostridium] dakarense]
MNLKKLNYIITIAELQSFSKAASKLYISQPSLSQIVLNLENDLGIQIFNRTTTPISLTYAGEKYIKTAKEIIRLSNNLQKEFSDISNMKKGKITIGITPLRGAFILPLILPKFMEKYPGIEIKIVEGDDNLENYLIEGKVDLVFTSLPTTDKRINQELLYKERIMLSCKKGYLDDSYLLDGNSNVIDINKLNDINLILTKKGHRIRNFMDNMFNSHEFNPKILLETDNTSTAFRLATSGLGACFVSDMVINTTKPIDEYDLFYIDDSNSKWSVAILYLKNSYLNIAEKYLIDLSKAVLNDKMRNDF